jgi:superfamily II DNA or RNA helicase
MADHLVLRPYQREAIDAVTAAWADGIRRPAVVMATGLGKTILFSVLASEFIARTGKRVLILVHRDELATQAMDKVHGAAPHLSVGKVKAQDNDVHADVVVASVQTLSRPSRLSQLLEAQEAAGPIGLVIQDEVHHGAAPSFRSIYDAFGCGAKDGALFLGVTATLARGDGTGLGSVVDDVVYEKSIAWGISRKFLSPVRGIAVRTPGLDLSGVRTSRGDYQAEDLGRALESSGALDILTKAYTEHAADRPGIVFLPTVETARHAADSLTGAGISTAVVSGATPREERIRIFEDYRTGRVQVLSNCMVLTEGFDAPHTSCIVMARPTQSNPLYIQTVGRGTRTYPGKTDCLVLDVVGAGASNKLCTLVDLEPGLFPEAVPCIECDRIPCRCPCAGCGGPRPCRVCAGGSELAAERGKTEETDLFAGSSQSWLTTRGGLMFVPAGESEVLLWPSEKPGMWDVAHAPKTGKWRRLHEAMPLGSAMAWAETDADELAPFNVRRTAAWRRKKPSEAQLAFARQLRVVLPADVRSGDLGDLISVALASRKLDRYLPRV